jgi:nucleotide-binding universal stress UspA family protein
VYPSYTEEHAEELKADFKLQATRELSRLLSTALSRMKVLPKEAPQWGFHVQYGSPRVVIEKAVKKAETDLLVLGTHGYSSLVLMLIGTVAGDVLRHVACDVLVVPPRQAKRK